MPDNDEKKQQLDEMIHYYKLEKEPGSQENITALLREVMDLIGYISPSVTEVIASELNVKPAFISRLIKLYPSLSSIPNRHRIVLCTGPSCSQKNAALKSSLEEAIKGQPFSLTTRRCLKNCRTAPNLTVDNDLYTGVTPEDVKDIIHKYVD